MKRLLLVAAFMLLPVALFAQSADRDVLLTPDGTLYTIESQYSDGTIPNITASEYLMLTIQHGTVTTRTNVPDSLASGIHWGPSLGYDPDSKTLFVFWTHSPNTMIATSELLVTSYHDGQWMAATSIDRTPFHLRSNFRIAVTRRVSQLQQDGTWADAPAVIVHAVWWEESGDGERARYAMLPIVQGNVASIDVHDLTEFASLSQTAYPVDVTFNPDILRHPAIIDTTSVDSIDVVFGDTTTDSFNRVTLKPVSDVRIRIPVGRGGVQLPPPASFSASWTGRIGTVNSGHDSDRMAFYNITSDSLSYVIYSDGKWSDVRTVSTSDRLTPDAAVTVLTRMLNQ